MKWFFLSYMFLEVLLTISIGAEIGGFNTFLEMVATAIIGIVIIANFKKILMQSIISIMNKELDAQQMVADNILALIGAILLVLPGFLSDIIGVLFQFGFIKNLIISQIKVPQKQQNYTHKGDDNVIDVEIIEHDTISK